MSRWGVLPVVVAALLLSSAPRWAGAQGPTVRTLVMPFEARGEARTWWLGEAASVLLAEHLRALGVDVIGREERMRAFARLQVPPVATLTHGTVIRVGQLVGAGGVVIGSLDVQGDRLSVRARNMRLDAGRLQPEVEERGALDELIAVCERVARRLVPLGGTVDPVIAPASARPSLPALENYIKGLLAETPATQVGFLEKAIALQPDYDLARLALWRALSDAEEHARARDAALTVPATSRLARRARFAAARSEIALRRYDDAFRRLQALGDESPAPEIHNNLGVIQLRRGATPEMGRATYWFTKASQAAPTEGDYFFNLGYAYWFEQDVQAALYWLREAVRRDPADADAHLVMAAALRVSGSGTEAARELELAGRLSADYERAREHGDYKVPQGLERVSAVLEPPGAARSETVLVATEQREQRELAAFHLDRGKRLYEKDSDREAITELRRALYLSPYLAEAHLVLGRIYLRGGRVRDAIDEFKIAIWSEATPVAHVALAEAWLQGKEVENARAEVQRALALDPAFAPARALLSQLPPE